MKLHLIQMNILIQHLWKNWQNFALSSRTFTAGNASGINDDASFVLLAIEDTVKKYNLKPIAEVHIYTSLFFDIFLMK